MLTCKMFCDFMPSIFGMLIYFWEIMQMLNTSSILLHKMGPLVDLKAMSALKNSNSNKKIG